MTSIDRPIEAQAGQGSLWRNRDYLLLWCGQMISTVGSEVSDLGFPLLVLAITGSPAQAGVVAALRALVGSLVMLPAGALVDRWDRKRVMLFCNLCRLLSLGSIPLALVFGWLSIEQLYLTALVEGTLGRVFGLAHSAGLAQVVEEKRLTAAVAVDEVTEGVTALGGPALGGLLFTLGRAMPFLVDAVSYVISLVTLLLVRTPLQGTHTRTGQHLLTEVREGLVWLWQQPFLRTMTLLAMSSSLSMSSEPLVVIVLAQQRGASPWLIGVIFALGGLGSIIGALFAASWGKRLRVGRAILLTRWSIALLWPLYILLPGPWLIGLTYWCIGFVDPIEDVSYFSFRLKLIPEKLRGRVLSVCRLFPSTSGAAGLFFTGLFLQWFGAVPTLFGQGLILLLGALAITFQRQFWQIDHQRPSV
jgi:MFS family permease